MLNKALLVSFIIEIVLRFMAPAAWVPLAGPAGEPSIPGYEGAAVLEQNDNEPQFLVGDITLEVYSHYSERDSLGRAGPAMAVLGRETMPSGSRSSLAHLEPSGWKSGTGIFERCHLIANQLAGNDTLENLITGTAYLNLEEMLPLENRVAMYISNTGNHVLYRVTPLYEGNNPIAAAVEMEAYSIEDYGAGICFDRLLYNVQPGYAIDYATGEIREDASAEQAAGRKNEEKAFLPLILPDSKGTVNMMQESSQEAGTREAAVTYVLNTNTRKFHYTYCDSVKTMKEKNREDFYGTREEAILAGYKPCGACCP